MTAAGQGAIGLLGWLGIWAALLLVGVGAYVFASNMQNRATMSRRMALAVGGQRRSRSALRMADGADSLKSNIGGLVSALGRLMPLSAKDREKISVSLQRAGYRSSNALTTVLGIKFACLVTGLVLGIVALSGMLPGLAGVGAGLVGGVVAGVFLNVFPELILGRLGTSRLRRINASIAETFDLLVVCLESGLTFERALKRTVDSLQSLQPDLAKEFGQVVLDMNVHGRSREDALGRLAERVDTQSFRDLAMTVTQSERHGTPLADALRKLAGSVRVETISRMQEKMARLPTLLVIPSISCILPGILIIVGGPAIVQLTQSLGDFGG